MSEGELKIQICLKLQEILTLGLIGVAVSPSSI